MKIKDKENIAGYLFTSPVILGIIIFNLGPIIFSLYVSFTNYDNLSKPQFIGLQNYTKMLAQPRFWNSVKITLIYSILSIAIGLFLSFFLAVLMNQKVKGIKIFRTIFYTPVVIPAVASAFVWMDLYGIDYGIINRVLGFFGIKPFPFLSSPKTALFSIIIMSLWGLGGNMLLWLAGFNNIPNSLYEAADIDGASRTRKLFSITIPMVTPVIFYNLVTGIIGALQTFGQAYVMTSGGPMESTNFLAFNIWNEGFVNLKMGYASAQAWFLFLIVFILTAIVFKTNGWVHYGE